MFLFLEVFVKLLRDQLKELTFYVPLFRLQELRVTSDNFFQAHRATGYVNGPMLLYPMLAYISMRYCSKTELQSFYRIFIF